MAPNDTKTDKAQKSPVGWIFLVLILIFPLFFREDSAVFYHEFFFFI